MTAAYPRVWSIVVAACLATGCAEPALQGNLFDIRLEGAENECTGGGTQYSDLLQYRLEFDSLDITLAVEDDEWAIGEVDGCFIEYRSIVVTSLREGYEIRWRIDGQAEIDRSGGASCIDEPNLDWIGTETFTVVRSAHPSVDPGCTYTLDVTGQFAGFASPPTEDDDTFVPPLSSDE